MLRQLPYLRCSIPIVFETGLITPPMGDRSTLTKQLLAGVHRLAWREHVLLTTFGHLTPDNAAWTALLDNGCRQLSRWWSTTLCTPWSDFDAYLASRTSADRREIGRLQRRAAREGVSVDHGPLHVEDAPRLRELIDSVLARHGAPDPYIRDFLPAAARILDSDLHVVQARQAGETVGCAVLVRSQDELLPSGPGWTTHRAAARPPTTRC